MNKHLKKAILWFMFFASFVIGAAAVHNTRTVGTEWSMLVICAFGLMYAISGIMWKDLPQKIVLFSVAMVAVLAVTAQYVPVAYYIATGDGLSWGYYKSWTFLLLIPGVPAILYMLKKHG